MTDPVTLSPELADLASFAVDEGRCRQGMFLRAAALARDVAHQGAHGAAHIRALIRQVYPNFTDMDIDGDNHRTDQDLAALLIAAANELKRHNYNPQEVDANDIVAQARNIASEVQCRISPNRDS